MSLMANNEIKRENIDKNLDVKAESETVFIELEKNLHLIGTSKNDNRICNNLLNTFSFRDSIVMIPKQTMNNNDMNAAKTALNDGITKKLFQGIKSFKDKTIKMEPSNEPDLTKITYKSFKDCIVFEEDLEDLYENHIFKEEMIIGPEVMQKTAERIFHNNDDTFNKTSKLKKKNNQAYISGKRLTSKECFNNNSCNNVFICDHCKKQFNMKHEISSHMKIHINRPKINNVIHKCDICSKVFTYPCNLKRHLKIHLGTAKIFTCDKCNKTFKSKEYFQCHYNSKHLDDVSKVIKKSHICRYCGKIHNNRSGCNHHEKFYCKRNPDITMKSKKKLTCDICQRTYHHKQSLIQHILLHMDLPTATSSKIRYIRKKVQCDLCLKKFSKKSSLKLHMVSIHLKIKNYSCIKCKMKFSRKWCLTSHEKNCHGYQLKSGRNDKENNTYSCKVCPNKYKTRVGLKYHMDSKHLNIKNYICDNCKSRFTRKWSLKNHEKKCLVK